MPKGNVKISVPGLAITPASKEVGEAFGVAVTLYNFGDFPIDVWLWTSVTDPVGAPIAAWTDKVTLGNQPTNREKIIPHAQASGWAGAPGDYNVEVMARVFTGAVPETGEILDQVSGVILHVSALQVTIMSVVAS